MSKEDTEPTRKPSEDGIYPRCVYCEGEIYGPIVYDYSLGKVPCGAVDGCGRMLPDSYVKVHEGDSPHE